MQLRAGESYSDADGVVSTNPVNKQSRYAQLTSLGKRQVVKRVAPALERMLGTNPAWIWPSINSCSYQTAEILTSVLGLGQSRLVPEYSFLDPRGLGALDGQAMADIRPMLQQGDASSELWRPPRGVFCADARSDAGPCAMSMLRMLSCQLSCQRSTRVQQLVAGRAGYDGTPNESAQDVLVRVRQVISITETQYDEETIVFVAPDSTVLTVLQAALLGVDLRDHWALFYECVS